MTTIVAIRDGKRTWIGSDMQATRGGTARISGSKWVPFGSWAVGIAGDLRAQSICAKHAKRLLDDLAGAFEFTERLEALLREYSFDLSPAPDDATPNTAQDMILACPNTIWSICADMSIVEIPDYWAEGSGYRFALGAMSAADRFKTIKSEDLARIALETAMKYDTGTGGDIWMDVLEE